MNIVLEVIGRCFEIVLGSAIMVLISAVMFEYIMQMLHRLGYKTRFAKVVASIKGIILVGFMYSFLVLVIGCCG